MNFGDKKALPVKGGLKLSGARLYRSLAGGNGNEQNADLKVNVIKPGDQRHDLGALAL